MPIRLNEARPDLPLAAGIALLGLALILAGTLATPRAGAGRPGSAIYKIETVYLTHCFCPPPASTEA
jgi:hypothetical protein